MSLRSCSVKQGPEQLALSNEVERRPSESVAASSPRFVPKCVQNMATIESCKTGKALSGHESPPMAGRTPPNLEGWQLYALVFCTGISKTHHTYGTCNAIASCIILKPLSQLVYLLARPRLQQQQDQALTVKLQPTHTFSYSVLSCMP